MTIDAQSIFNVLGAIIFMLFGYLINDVKSRLKENSTKTDDHAKQIHAIEKLVVGSCIKRDDFDRTMNESFKLIRQVQASVVELNQNVVAEINQIKVDFASVHGSGK